MKSSTIEELCAPDYKLSGQPQQFKYGYEVPKKVLEEYDWPSKVDKEYGWLKHQGTWYHLSDFMRVGIPSALADKWDGYISDSFFSGVLIKLTEDNEGAYLRTYIN